MQKLRERLSTFADATTLLMIIAFIALAAWLWRTAARRASDLRSSAPPLLSSSAETRETSRPSFSC